MTSNAGARAIAFLRTPVATLAVLVTALVAQRSDLQRREINGGWWCGRARVQLQLQLLRNCLEVQRISSRCTQLVLKVVNLCLHRIDALVQVNRHAFLS